MASKDVKYFNTDFDGLKKDLRTFAQKYYPDTYNDFTEASPGQMFMDMAAYVGDVLGFEINRALNENFVDRASERKNLYEIASTYGYKPTLGSSALTDVTMFQQIPAIGSGESIGPDMRYALTIGQGAVLSTAGGVQFLTTEPVDFVSTASVNINVYQVDSSGEPTYYLAKKSVRAKAGKLKTQTFTITDPIKYLELRLDDKNIASILSVTDSEGSTWYEVPYLALDTVFFSLENTQTNAPDLFQYRDETPFLLKARKTAKRFRTYLDTDSKMVIQFGSGVSSNNDEVIVPNPQNIGLGIEGSDAEIDQSYDPSNFLFTKTYGEVPSDTTLTITYLVGYGNEANVATNQINTIVESNVNFATSDREAGKSSVVLSSLGVINDEVPARGGRARDTIENIRQGAIGALYSQRRAVTKEDYVIRALTMPPRFGQVAKAWIERNPTDQFTLDLYVLGYDSNGNLTALNDATKRNLKNYLSAFRLITDSINIRDGYVINIGVNFEITVLPRFNNQEVLLNCIEAMKNYFDISKMNFKQPIVLKELLSILALVPGVQTIPQAPIIYVKNDVGYAPNYYPIDAAYRNGIIYPSYDPTVFEVKFPNDDIEGRVSALF